MNIRILAWPLCTALLAACGGGTSGTDARPTLVTGDAADPAVASIHQMPTPNELFSLVRDMAGEGHRRVLNPDVNAARYVSRKARALNLGIYATDLVYASYFKLNVEVARYYVASKRLAENLGISSAFTDEDFVRLEGFIAKGVNDSLEAIGNAAYQRAYEKLQEDDKGVVLALVLAGGWVEGMYLVMRQMEAFGANPSLMARVAEQKVTLEQLLMLVAPHAADPDVEEVHADLLLLRDIYDQVNVKRIPHEGRSTSGRMVLGDDVQFDLTPEKYRNLMEVVSRLRQEYAMPEDAPNA